MKLKNLAIDEFSVEPSVEEGRMNLHFRGAIHAAQPEEFLSPYLDRALEEASEGKLRLVCDFRELEYMNSASIPPLIHLLRRMAELQVEGEFIYDASRKVQTASFRALDVIARKSEFTSVRGV
ncbi:MAG: hypothetical protein K1X75_14515 [Leptospirales bacterium]|nr:hypothetical protein [Leptospirales bacterium]